MRARILAGVVPFLVWLLLWGEISVANVLSGIAVVVFLFVVFPPALSSSVIRIHPVLTAYLIVWFAWKVIVSNVLLVRLVLSPSRMVHRGVIAVPLRGCSESLVRVVAHLTALTPGTVVVEARTEPSIIFIHAFMLSDINRARQDTLRMNELVVHAFGTPDEIAELEGSQARRDAS